MARSRRRPGETQAPRSASAFRQRLAELEARILELGQSLSERQLIPPCKTPDAVIDAIEHACKS